MGSLDFGPIRQSHGKAFNSSHELALGPKHEPMALRSDTLRSWLKTLEGYPDDARLLDIVRQINENEDLEAFLLKSVQGSPQSLTTLDSVDHMIAFFRQHPDWWSQNVEAVFENLSAEGRKNKSGLALLKFDIETGTSKAVYKFGKGVVTGVWDILRFAYYLFTDANTRTTTLNIMEKCLSLYVTLRFGSADAKARAMKEIEEFTEKLMSEMASFVTKKWDEAKANGTEAQLISEWTVRGVLEIATALYAAVKGAEAISASTKVVEVAQVTAKSPKYVSGPVILKRFQGNRPTMIMKNAGHVPAGTPKAAAVNKHLIDGLLDGLKQLEKEGVDVAGLGERQKATFKKAYREYAKINGMSPKDRKHIYRFRKGASLFVSEEAFEKFMAGKVKVGYPDNTQYVTTKGAADRLMKSAGSDSLEYARRIGFKPQTFEGKRVVRVDFKFRLEYNPRIPTGKEKGANEFFTGTNWTSGGMPEAVFDRIPVMDIEKVTSLGVLE